MNPSADARRAYFMGHSNEETRRLRLQASLYDPFTYRLLVNAGISNGMKVLDLGTGAGDVALLVAKVVGPSGRVIGLDRNPAILETAREQVDAYPNISFVSGTLETAVLDRDFDAVVGRLVLMHMPHPVEMLRLIADHVRPGGIVLIEDLAALPMSVPPCPTMEQSVKWVREALQRAEINPAIGYELYRLFLEADFRAPQLEFFAPTGSGPDWIGYDYIVSTTREILLQDRRQHELATHDEVRIDELADRLRDEVVRQKATVLLAAHMGAWAHTE